jgi:murein DD-endopeptidase MepM/ murein hydrolase activator NlpD
MIVGRNRAILCRACLALVFVLLWPVVGVAAQGPTPTPGPPVYVVKAGDTLFAIAERFGSTVDAIVAANDILDPSLIQVGQRLLIPTAEPELVPPADAPPESRVHPIRPGDTLPGLAFRYGTTPWALREANADLDPHGLLWQGQELVVPPASVPHAGVPHMPAVSAGPMPLIQGQTVVVEVAGSGELEISGWFLGQELAFYGGEGSYWALIGIDALTAPGEYPVALRAVEEETGDHLTLQNSFLVTGGAFTRYNVVVPASRTNLLDPQLSVAEREKVNAVFALRSETRLWNGTFGLPLAGELRVTAPFGQRRSYNSGPVSSYHSGLDLGADSGTPVMAPMTGTVVLAEALQVRGNAVILDHGLGVFSAFWHLSQIDVGVGQVVGRGQIVGLVGDTGLSTGPHLHWEMQVCDVPVDPMQWTAVTFP